MLTSLSHERFEILDRLGSGSFGVVFEAFDHYRNRRVALKVLERASAESVARFKREFRTLAEVRHTNLASLYELLSIGDQWVLSMELIRGTELLEHLAASELQHAFVELRTQTLPVLDLDATVKLRRSHQKSALSAVCAMRSTGHPAASARPNIDPMLAPTTTSIGTPASRRTAMTPA